MCKNTKYFNLFFYWERLVSWLWNTDDDVRCPAACALASVASIGSHVLIKIQIQIQRYKIRVRIWTQIHLYRDDDARCPAGALVSVACIGSHVLIQIQIQIHIQIRTQIHLHKNLGNEMMMRDVPQVPLYQWIQLVHIRVFQK